MIPGRVHTISGAVDYWSPAVRRWIVCWITGEDDELTDLYMSVAKTYDDLHGGDDRAVGLAMEDHLRAFASERESAERTCLAIDAIRRAKRTRH